MNKLKAYGLTFLLNIFFLLIVTNIFLMDISVEALFFTYIPLYTLVEMFFDKTPHSKLGRVKYYVINTLFNAFLIFMTLILMPSFILLVFFISIWTVLEINVDEYLCR
jgi:hypothetical protein